MTKQRIHRLVLSALLLALGLVLPFLTGQIPEVGSRLLPLHLPALLCGCVCGWPWGLAVGAVLPVLRSFLFGMPPLMPTGAAMCFELAAYGAVAGLLYRALPRSTRSVYLSLIAAMLCGRILWGIVRVLLTGVTGSPFTWAAFLSGAFTSAVPGMILHLLLIPVIVLALERALPWLKAHK